MSARPRLAVAEFVVRTVRRVAEQQREVVAPAAVGASTNQVAHRSTRFAATAPIYSIFHCRLLKLET